MDNLDRIWAYYLAIPMESDLVNEVLGGRGGELPPTIHLTGDPLAPDMSKDH